MKRLTALVCVAFLAAACWPAFSLGLVVVDEAHWRPGPPEIIPPPGPPHHPPRPIPIVTRFHCFAPLQLELCKVDARIKDQVAVTTIEQTFRNPNPQRLEGSFIFPVPKGAHLDKFTLEIDGKPVEAELLDAAKARSIYEDIVRRARDPALLEYDGQDLFKVRIFPINGNSTRHISIRYTQVLKRDAGLVGYTLPLNTAKYSATPIRTLSVKATLETSRPIKTLYSPSHTLEIRHDGGRKATVGYEASDSLPDTDLSLYYGMGDADVGMSFMTYREGDDDGYFLLLASPGADVTDDKVVPKDVVFVLDTSGSMAGKKIEQARKAFAFCVANLNKDDRFEVLRFSTEVEPVFGELTVASEAQRAKADAFISELKATGGTSIDDALRQALSMRASGEDRPFVVIFLTDGLPTVGVTAPDQILANVKERACGKVRVFCFGIGTDVNTHLLDKITEETRASSQYVLPNEDIEVKVSSFFAKIKDPVLANPVLRFTGDPRLTRLHPSDLPDLFRGEQLVVAGRYNREGGADIVLEGTVNGRKRVFEHHETLPACATENDFIPRLWANRRVGWLLDQIRLHGENKELKDEVVELAREHGIVTPYTAWLILEDEGRRNVPLAAQSLPLLRKDANAQQTVRALADGYEGEVSGDAAVSYSVANNGFRQADNLASVNQVRSEASRMLAAAPALAAEPPVGRAGVAAFEQQRSQFVGGRNFYLNDGRWVDAQVQQYPNAKRVQLQFGSKDYFAFAAANPEVRPWLAQGANVEFAWKGVVYQVSE